MSFILDALKKSEAERQRQTGPTLLEVRLLPPAPRWPAWSMAVGALLLINLGALAWFVWRHPAPAAASASASAAAAAAAAPAGTPVPAGYGRPVTAPGGVAGPPAAPGAFAAQPSAAATPDSISPAGRAGSVTIASAPINAADSTPAPAGSDSIAAAADSNPADYQPALSRAAAVAASSDGHVRMSSEDDTLPNYSDLAGTLPLLRLDLHVYSDNPGQRYALINMHTAHEGDTLPDGERVVRISPQGVILDYNGQRFILRQQ